MLSSCGKYLRGLPHVRGGVSDEKRMPRRGRQSSPRAWGCFRGKTLGVSMNSVFPTCVGVFPPLFLGGGKEKSLPHVRGGVSHKELFCSPEQRVFPTCVGVFLTTTKNQDFASCLPHVRGGVSTAWDTAAVFIGSSPRAWGCFS